MEDIGDQVGAGVLVLRMTRGMDHLTRSKATMVIWFFMTCLVVFNSANTDLVTQPISNNFINIFETYQQFIVESINCLLIEQKV